ncbi:MFS transporter [Streptomyces nitrosporeus]|uniref:MFS transporter n=1 Tax=Streptomyces nitrosporeus TaxID=28894 RepID=A0A5J6FDM4_9ACTN|nr:MFS transporter [Streptomyces nitrosporeus]QEU74146.1 MFS transporter [Streptomyces nitrosporeus]GGZ26397.1 MFS transporter [Streptomyces nitrosporeus]
MTAPATLPPAAAPAEPPPASVTTVVGLLILFEVTSGFLQAGLAPLLPDLAGHLGIGSAALNWVVSVQLLAAAVCVPLFGRLGDLYGHRRMLRVALAAIAVGTLVVALAPDYGTLLAGRVLQGPIAALLPLEIALVRDRLPVADARRAIARLVGALTLGAMAGGVVMGLVDSAFGDLRLTLLVPAALAALCVPVSFVAVPETRNRAGGRVDWAGVTLLSGAMIALLGGVSGAQGGSWGSARVLGPVVLGLVLLAVWVRVELRSREPLVDVRALAARTTAPFYCAAFLFGVFYFGSQTPNSTFYAADPDTAGYGFGLDALSISLVLLPGALGSVVGSLGTAALAARIGYRPTLMAAFGLVALTFCQFALLHEEVWQMAAGSAFTGLGIGLALGAMPTVIVEASDPARTGISAALYNNVKTLGGAVAGGVFASLLGAFSAGLAGEPGEGGYTALWLVSSGAALAALVMTALARRREG